MAKKITFEIDIDEKGAVTSINKVGDSVEKVAKDTKKAESGFKKMGKSVGSFIKSLGLIGIALAVFDVLKESLGKNQKVMDTLATATNALSIAFNDLFTFIADNAQSIIDVFSNPLKSIEKLGDKIKDYVITRFKSMVTAVGLAGEAILEFVKGNFSEASDLAKKAVEEGKKGIDEIGKEYNRLKVEVEKAAISIKDYTKSTYEQAKAITQAEKATRLLAIEQRRLKEEADFNAEIQRQIRDDELKGIDDRIKANIKLGEILKTQLETESATVNTRIENAKLKLALDKNNIEVQEEIAELEAELFAIKAQQAGFESEQLINTNSLLREKAELQGFQTQAELEAFETQEAIRQREIKDSEAAIAQAKKEAKEKIAQEKVVNNAKVNLAQATAGLIGEFAEQDSKLGKAAAVTQATIDTIQGAQSAFAQTPGGIVLKSAAAAIAVGVGISNVKKILAVKPVNRNSSKSVGATSASAAPPAATVTPPQFSTAADTGTSQLAADINQQNEPVQAYVVSERVTNQQQLDRQVEINTQF